MRTATVVITASMRELLRLYAPMNGPLEATLRDWRPILMKKLVLRLGEVNAGASPYRDDKQLGRELRVTYRLALARPGLSEQTAKDIRLNLSAVDDFLDTSIVDRVAELA